MARQLMLFERLNETAQPVVAEPRVTSAASNSTPASLRPSTFVALDFETADAAHRYPIALGLVRVEHGAVVEEAYHLIHAPARVFNAANTAVHGIPPSEVAQAAEFPEVLEAVRPLLHGVAFVAAHHAPFDRGVLAAACRRYNLRPPGHAWVCTRRLAKRTWSLRRGGLAHVAAHLGLVLNHHQALSDARACAQIVLHASPHGEPLDGAHG